ncbi:MAG TPA: redoxin domain-containing protein, partial [Phnomibacter sp.]|nr:redoxin domain-containing protein [Phnomibacter sp.]
MKFRIPRFLFLTGAVCLHSLLVTAQSFKPQSIRVAPLMERASQHKGVLVINFWSTWCKPCIQEIPHFLTVAAADTAVQLWLVSQDTKTLYSSGK